MQSRGVGTCLRLWGQTTGILRKNLYFDAILVKIQQKWGAGAPFCPLVSNTPDLPISILYPLVELFEKIFEKNLFLGSPNPPAEMKLTPPSSPHVGSGHNVFSSDGSQPQSGAKER